MSASLLQIAFKKHYKREVKGKTMSEYMTLAIKSARISTAWVNFQGKATNLKHDMFLKT